MNKLGEEKREKSDQLENFLNYTFIIISKVFFLPIFRFYTLQAFQWYQKRLKRSSDEKVMSETKSEAKHSEIFATIAKIYHSENFAMCAKFSLCLIANLFVFFLKNKIK